MVRKGIQSSFALGQKMHHSPSLSAGQQWIRAPRFSVVRKGIQSSFALGQKKHHMLEFLFLWSHRKPKDI